MKTLSWWLSCLGVWMLVACDVPEAPEWNTSSSEYGTAAQELGAPQGSQLQGSQLQGSQLQGTELLGVRFTGISLNGKGLLDARVEQGGLVAEQTVPLSGSTRSFGACSGQVSGDDRACGYSSMGVGSCTPGQIVQVGAGGCNLGWSQGDTVMRVCSGTSPCEDSSTTMLATSAGACGTVSPHVSFTCPSSGYYNVMGGPQVTNGLQWRMGVQASVGQLPARQVLSGTALQGAQLSGVTGGAQSLQLRIAQVVNGANAVNGIVWDASGDTYVYRVEYYEPGSASWMPLCSQTMTGSNWAVPITGVFDSTGARDDSNPNLFTFGCENGVIAKCYRWGYKPWMQVDDPNDADLLPNPDLMKEVHWACTRMARADYCGDGKTHTQNGTLINLWDALEPQIQTQGVTPLGLAFESGWNTQGAVCLSHDRWVHLKPDLCPNKLYAPGYLVTGGEGVQCSPGEHAANPTKKCASVCDLDEEALIFDTSVRLFNESRLNSLDPLP